MHRLNRLINHQELRVLKRLPLNRMLAIDHRAGLDPRGLPGLLGR
ncbi:MAG: hypothetical protein QMD10_12955 [Desulfitobacteriaceae bacterium]|nr:hypothetical protein [Desulfitobacteriaceae bacterium]